jgi:hypothetical protein
MSPSGHRGFDSPPVWNNNDDRTKKRSQPTADVMVRAPHDLLTFQSRRKDVGRPIAVSVDEDGSPVVGLLDEASPQAMQPEIFDNQNEIPAQYQTENPQAVHDTEQAEILADLEKQIQDKKVKKAEKRKAESYRTETRKKRWILQRNILRCAKKRLEFRHYFK